MAGIPEDVIIEILLRLPVGALLRFRCVSRRWRNLIDSPNFVRSQLNLPKKPQFVMILVFDKKLRIYYSELDSDYIENPSPNFKELTISWLDDNFSNVNDYVGHCNGLLCCVRRNQRSFVVLNPFTGKRIQVPPPEQQGCWSPAWGFGYDGDSDDYKIVALEYFRNRGRYRGVLRIYSLKYSCWKNISVLPYNHIYSNGVFVNDALHWIVSCHKGDPPKSIFALNLGNLEYFYVPPPSDSSKILSHLGVLDGCLYAIYTEYYDHIACYELWVMMEYGLEESWTRLHTYNGHFFERELVFVSYGNSLVECKFGSFWRKIWNAGSLGFGKPMSIVYEPSLVCPRSGI